MYSNPASQGFATKFLPPSIGDALYGQLLSGAQTRFQTFNEIPIPSFADYAQSTLNFPLHDWQVRHLCPLLERFRTERGLRICIHAPPQFGKSVLYSQRLPAYLMGADPLTRVGLACYNQTHSTAFGGVVLDLMQSPEYAETFPDPRARVPGVQSAARFSTAGREAQRDGQNSLSCLGMQSGFVGKGLDQLFIDDPYASAEEARSEAINERTSRWWNQTASVRVPDTANVGVLFHRYGEDDFAGRLLSTGKWEHFRFPAVADENADGSDPTGRKIGELLSPMRSRAWLDAQESEDPQTFLGQFEGTPRAQGGVLFKDSWFSNRYKSLPAFKAIYTIWDTALKTGEQNDETACMTFGEGVQGGLYVLRAWSARAETPDVVDFLIEQAWWFREKFGSIYQGDYVEDKVSGTTLIQFVKRHADADRARAHDGSKLAVIGIKVETDKVSRAKGVTPLCAGGNVLWPDPDVFPATAGWARKCLNQITSFPFAKHDDVCDVFVYGVKKFMGTLNTGGNKPRRGRAGGWA